MALALANPINSTYAGNTAAKKSTDPNQATYTLVAELHSYTSLTKEIADVKKELAGLETQIKDEKQKTADVYEERRQNIARIKEAYAPKPAPEEPQEQEVTIENRFTFYSREEGNASASSSAPKKDNAAPHVPPQEKQEEKPQEQPVGQTLEDIFTSPLTFTVGIDKKPLLQQYGLSFEQSTKECVVPQDPCPVEKEENVFNIYTIKKEGADEFLIVYTVRSTTVDKKGEIAPEFQTTGDAVKTGVSFTRAAEYIEGTEGRYIFLTERTNLTPYQQNFIENKYAPVAGKVAPLLAAKVKALEAEVKSLESQKPVLEKQLEAAKAQYMQTQLPPGM